MKPEDVEVVAWVMRQRMRFTSRSLEVHFGLRERKARRMVVAMRAAGILKGKGRRGGRKAWLAK